jgi:hypothetical protein
MFNWEEFNTDLHDIIDKKQKKLSDISVRWVHVLEHLWLMDYCSPMEEGFSPVLLNYIVFFLFYLTLLLGQIIETWKSGLSSVSVKEVWE